MNFAWTPQHSSLFTDYHVITRGCSRSAAHKYCEVARMFFGWVQSNGLPLSKNTVEEWMKYLVVSRGNHSNATRASRLSALRSVCAWLVDTDKLPSNPCDGVPTPKVSKTAAQKFSHSELRDMFSIAENETATTVRDRCILMLFYATGMRREEMANLTIHRITLAHRTGRVHVIGKGAKQRVIPFEGPIVGELTKWLVVRQMYAADSEDSFFISFHGNRHQPSGGRMGIRGMHDVIKRVSKRVGLKGDVFLHKLRSTYATELYDHGIGVQEIALLMGHSSIETTMRYIAISERHLQKSRLGTAHWQSILGN